MTKIWKLIQRAKSYNKLISNQVGVKNLFIWSLKGYRFDLNPLNANHDKLHCTLLWSMYCLNFREKIDLDISYESSISRQLTWNVVPYLIPRTATNFKSAVCFLWACESNRVSFNYCVRNVWFILQAQWKNVVLISTQRTHDKVIYMEIKNTQHGAWYLWSMTRQK